MVDAIRTVVGVDTAKRVCRLHWGDMETGEVVDVRRTRAKFLEHFANRTPCTVALEACSGSQHGARRLCELGHEVQLPPAKAVRPYRRLGYDCEARTAMAAASMQAENDGPEGGLWH